MYRVSLEGLRMMDYCSGVKYFINYALFNLKNSSRDGIKYPYKTYKNKKFLDPNIKKYLCILASPPVLVRSMILSLSMHVASYGCLCGGVRGQPLLFLLKLLGIAGPFMWIDFCLSL